MPDRLLHGSGDSLHFSPFQKQLEYDSLYGCDARQPSVPAMVLDCIDLARRGTVRCDAKRDGHACGGNAARVDAVVPDIAPFLAAMGASDAASALSGPPISAIAIGALARALGRVPVHRFGLRRMGRVSSAITESICEPIYSGVPAPLV